MLELWTGDGGLKVHVTITSKSHTHLKYMYPLVLLTSSNGDPLLQDADVELQSELGGRSQEGLNDRGAGEGCSVCKQFPLRLPHLPFHLLRLTPARDLLLPGDADIRLLHAAHTAIDTERLQTPTGTTTAGDHYELQTQ